MKKFSAVALLLLSLLTLNGCERNTTYDAFTQCLADSGAKMYGAFWCPHCQEQKKIFGDSKDLLPYVECDPNGKNANPQACAINGVKGYPTWIFADSTREERELSLEALSEKTGCELPEEMKSSEL